MKPKKRESQKQTARMFLRRQDHRDVIYEKNYHNAIYLYKRKRDAQGQPTQQIETNDYVWIKYPKHALLSINTPHLVSSPCNNFNMGRPGLRGWIDLDRQFQYAVSEGGIYRTNINYIGNMYQKLGKYVLILNCIAVAYSEDGIRWYNVSNTALYDESQETNIGVSYLAWSCRYGQHGLASVYVRYTQSETAPDATFTRYLIDFSKGRHEGCLYGTSKSTVLIEHGQTDVKTYGPEIGRRGGYVYYAWTREKRTTVKYLAPTNSACLVLRILVDEYITYEWDGYTGVQTSYTCNEIYTYLYIDEDCNQDIAYYWTDSPASARENYTFNQYKFNIVTTFNLGNVVAYVFSTNWYDESPIITPGGMTYHRWHNSVHIAFSHNNGYSWTISEIEDFQFVNTDKNYYTNLNAQIFFRKGKYYLMCSCGDVDGYKVHLYSSLTGSSWSEIPLPKWYDLPLSTESGSYTQQYPTQETVRIAVDPLETSDYDYMMHDLYGNVKGNVDRPSYSGYYSATCYSDIRFKDGSVDESNDTFFIVLGGRPVEARKQPSGYHNIKPGVFAYIDMEHHSKDFALLIDFDDASNRQIPEQVLDYDYCAPAGGFAGDTPDPDLSYVYYIWDEENEKFIGVDRHLSTYAHYTIVYVNELPERGQTMILYGLRTDLNANPIYDYYVYEDNQFVQITSFTGYTHHTVLVVSQLPETGAENIIYAVAKDTTSFSTYMYIWNPDAIWYEFIDDQYIERHGAFEDINYTTYDMTGKNFVTVNVKQLPNRGKEGIIYCSETKITTTVGTTIETNYNYYIWDPENITYILVTPVMSMNNKTVLTVEILDPPDPSFDTTNVIFRIHKDLDGQHRHTMYESESSLKEYLERRTNKHDQWLTSTDDLPFVGTSDIFYIIRETPTERTGKYTVYKWNKMTLKYNKTNEYTYYIPEPGQEEPDNVMKYIPDVINYDNLTGE